MFNLVSMNAIKADFDSAMEKQGYVRAKVLCDKWGITTDKFNRLIKKGFECDSFVVNGVRYVQKDSVAPSDIWPKPVEDHKEILEI